MKYFTLLILACCISLLSYSQVRMTVVDPVAKNITLKNMGSMTVDLSSYWFCSLFNYNQLGMSPVTVLVGDLGLNPGETVTVNWFTGGMAVTGSDLALYQTPDFTNPAAMADFVQWVSAGNGRESEANIAGLWVAGTFISGDGPYYFSGGATDSGLNFWSNNPPQPPLGPCSEIFFSEYVEGSSNNKALELYNPTPDAIDLANYEVHRYNNGSTTSPAVSGFNPGTMLNSGSVYVFGNGSAVVEITGVSDTLSAVTFFNGDDALILLNITTGDTLDVIGNLGEDPGTNWPVDTGATSEFTLVRKITVQQGNTDWSVGATQWDVYPQNEFSFLGSHEMEPCGPPEPEPCEELFFSEYVEGSSNNKAFEVYNPTSATVDLSNYVIYRNNNGSITPTDSLFPQAILAAGDVFVIANPSADPIILAEADTTHTLSFYNGDDAVWLKNISTGDTLDVIGRIGEDPGTGWVVGTGATNEYTLVRKSTVQLGSTDWNVGATEWDVYAQNDFSFLGSHTMIPCGVTTPVISFASASVTIDESAGTFGVQVSLSNNNGSAVEVTLDVIGGSATNGMDFSATFPVTISFTGTLDETLVENITIIDDLILETAETIEFQLSMPTNGAELGTSELILTIADNDQPIPVYDIGEINTVNAAGVSDSCDVLCEIRGVVYGVNLRPAGLQFTIIDPTGGIGTFSLDNNFGYTVLEGDSIACVGSIDQFNGLTQMALDTVIFLTASNPIADPEVVTGLGEDTESNLVMMECVYIINPAQWSNSGSGFNVDVTNGSDTIQMRIDADTDIFGSSAPTGVFNLIGIGGQFDSSIPYLSGYQLLPRYMADISDDTGCTQPPANNDCFGSVDIDNLFHQGFEQVQESGIFTNVGATVAGTDPPFGWECFGEPDGGGSSPSIENTTWYSFVGDGETYSISTTDCNGTVTDYIDDGDTQMAIYSGDCNSLVGLACNEDSPLATSGNFFAGLDFETMTGVNYFILIDGFNFNGAISDGEFCIQINQLTTGLLELSELGVVIYPNPVNDVLNIQSKSFLIEGLEVYNALGALMVREAINDLNGNVSTEGWAPGVYTARILLEGELYQQVIIKH